MPVIGRPLAVAALATLALFVPGAAWADGPRLAVNVTADWVIATGLPPGPTTVQVTRPDRVTGDPVVIGQYQGYESSPLPFTVNTTTPTALNPGGDCWQNGALSLPGGLGLTPDILPGDTVAVVGGPSLTVPTEMGTGDSGSGGPIAGCDALSLWAHNAVTEAGIPDPGVDLAVSGRAQPMAEGVSVTATDSRRVATPSVEARIGADGSWTATIPAGSLAMLADGPVTVAGDYAVPDVSTGAPAHIGGVPRRVDKASPVPSSAPVAPSPADPPSAATTTPPTIALHGLRLRSHMSLRAARAGKLRVSFVVPTAANVVRVRLSRGPRTWLETTASAAAAGTRQTIALRGHRMAKLTPGRYTVGVSAGATRASLGAPVLRGFVRITDDARRGHSG